MSLRQAVIWEYRHLWNACQVYTLDIVHTPNRAKTELILVIALKHTPSYEGLQPAVFRANTQEAEEKGNGCKGRRKMQ